jgi:hypothetical protein
VAAGEVKVVGVVMEIMARIVLEKASVTRVTSSASSAIDMGTTPIGVQMRRRRMRRPTMLKWWRLKHLCC